MPLERFRTAQDRIWPEPLDELVAGRKVSHWMWFVFPQLRGLGRSETARFYGIEDLAEARAYLADPVLAERLEAAARAMLRHPGTRPEAILGHTDALKLRSSATLFAAAGAAVFDEVLAEFYDGPDPLTLDLLGR